MPIKRNRVQLLDEFNRSSFLDPEKLIERSERSAKAHGLPVYADKNPHQSLTITPLVKEFADQFPNTIQGILQMSSNIKSLIKLEKNTTLIAKAHYGLQTAHDIIKKRKIPAPFDRKNEPIFGCNSLCVVVAACLKAKRIPYKFVRTVSSWEHGGVEEPHTVVIFRLRNSIYVTDPFKNEGEGPITQQINPKLKARIEQLKRLKRWVEGKSPEELGIYSYEDFYKHDQTKKK